MGDRCWSRLAQTSTTIGEPIILHMMVMRVRASSARQSSTALSLTPAIFVLVALTAATALVASSADDFAAVADLPAALADLAAFFSDLWAAVADLIAASFSLFMICSCVAFLGDWAVDFFSLLDQRAQMSSPISINTNKPAPMLAPITIFFFLGSIFSPCSIFSSWGRAPHVVGDTSSPASIIALINALLQ